MTTDLILLSSDDLRHMLRTHAANGDEHLHLALREWGAGAWDAFCLDAFPEATPLPVTLVCDLDSPGNAKPELERLLARGARVIHRRGQVDGLWAFSMPWEPPCAHDPWGSWDFSSCGTLSRPHVNDDPHRPALPVFTRFDEPKIHRRIVEMIEDAQTNGGEVVTPALLARFRAPHARLHLLRLRAQGGTAPPVSVQLWLDAEGRACWKEAGFGCRGEAGADDCQPFVVTHFGTLDFGSDAGAGWRDVPTSLAKGKPFAQDAEVVISWPGAAPTTYRIHALKEA